MKILLSWLKDYIDVEGSADQIAEVLSDLGFPCEGIERLDDDAVIDIEVTSNRGDCLGYIGIARELSAATGKKLKTPPADLEGSSKEVSEFCTVEITDPQLCGRYTARIIEGVKVAPSPDWLKYRLEAIGLRTVNNIVDATNYAMIETGQPPHAFDYDKIADGKIIVRKAAPGERIVSIDGSKCELDTRMLIIADDQKPLAIAGVMGGLDTEVSETTTTILLEDASFDPVSIRTTSRKLAIPSEASFRFERTVDIKNIDQASKRTAALIIKAAGGKAAKGIIDIYPNKPQPKEICLRISRLNKLLGIEVPQQDAVNILASLNFQPEQKDDLITCTIPSWRSDVYREVDLIEEVARVYGYDKIPTESKISIEVAPLDKRQKLTETIGTYLNGCGFYETISVTFVDDSLAQLFASEKGKDVAVKDVSRKSANLLRQSLATSLLEVVKTNLNANNTPCRIFEIADTFVSADPKEKLPIEKTKVAIACDSDFRDLRGVVEGLIKNIDRQTRITFTPANFKWAEAGANIIVNENVIGIAGVVSNETKDKFDIKNAAVSLAELDFEQLCSFTGGDLKVKPIPRFPAIERDLSIIIDESIIWADIQKAVSENPCGELKNVNFVGVYRGKGIEDGKKSVTLSLTFRDTEGTLKHETVDRFQADILESLKRSLSAELRTA